MVTAHAQRPPMPWRLAGRRRPAFQTCPHASHRQYDDSSAFAAVVMIFGERQNGHATGAGPTCRARLRRTRSTAAKQLRRTNLLRHGQWVS